MKTTLFRGGTRLPCDREYVGHSVHTVYEPAGELVIPLSGPHGVRATPTVAAGEPVLVGTRLSECPEQPALGAHSPCSGTVKAIERRLTARGWAECLVLDNDRAFRPAAGADESEDWRELNRTEILRRIREAGASGVCPRQRPSAAKLEALDPEEVSHVAVDASEWEPLVSSDDDLLRTGAYGVVTGLRILLRLFPGAEGVILLGDDKKAAADALTYALRGAGGIRVQAVAAGRPLGNEALLRRYLGGNICLAESPAEVNAVYEAVCRQQAFVRRIVTVAGGAVNRPGNYRVRLGTSCAELLAAAGGLKPGVTLARAVLGGPVTGMALTSLDVPVEKDTAAVLFLSEEEQRPVSECFRCGACADVCPAGLLPMALLDAAQSGALNRFKALHGLACIHCGACSAVCPAGQNPAQAFITAATALGAGPM